MKVIRDAQDPLRKKPVGEMAPGTAVINGEGNLCIVLKSPVVEEYPRKTRLANVENGGNYSVLGTCCYEVVEATVTWRRVPA